MYGKLNVEGEGGEIEKEKGKGKKKTLESISSFHEYPPVVKMTASPLISFFDKVRREKR